LVLASASCGGSSSETPPPLEPVPANVHYDRSATTLPGELGGQEQTPAAKPAGGARTKRRSPAPPPSEAPEPAR
jgi:hypothetical protein